MALPQSTGEPTPAPRERIAKLFSYVEDAMYLGLAVLLASALLLLASTASSFWRGLVAGTLPGGIVDLLDRLLLVLMIVEILYTVQVSFREHVITAPPFLLVALIAAVRRIIVLTAATHELSESNPDGFVRALAELALLTLMALGLVVCLYLLRTRTPQPAAERA